MTKMNARLQQLFHCNNRHVSSLPVFPPPVAFARAAFPLQAICAETIEKAPVRRDPTCVFARIQKRARARKPHTLSYYTMGAVEMQAKKSARFPLIPTVVTT
jgi:hypothetical protein